MSTMKGSTKRMDDDRITLVTHGRVLNSLNYLIIEHSNVAPRIFIEYLFGAFDFGILFLGIDGPHIVSKENVKNLIEAFEEKAFPGSLREGFFWVDSQEVLKLAKNDLFVCEGNALVLKTEPPEKGFTLPHLPKPSGFRKDKISLRDAGLLDEVLCDNDIYLHDDFVDCFIVTKSKEIFNLILEKVEEMSGQHKKTKHM